MTFSSQAHVNLSNKSNKRFQMSGSKMRANQIHCLWWVISCQYSKYNWPLQSVPLHDFKLKQCLERVEFRWPQPWERPSGKVGGFSEGSSDTAISIGATFLLISPSCQQLWWFITAYFSAATLKRSDNTSDMSQWRCWWRGGGGGEREMNGTFPWRLRTNKLVESDEEVLIKSKSWDLKDEGVLCSVYLHSMIITEQTEMAAV